MFATLTLRGWSLLRPTSKGTVERSIDTAVMGLPVPSSFAEVYLSPS
ncbi:hypothetical protein [Bacillus vallismortis]|nr:hypothetical protein [Bacillus vallismortis]MCY7919151.1 hypothetical protein [Bacillus vallismortis]